MQTLSDALKEVGDATAKFKKVCSIISSIGGAVAVFGALAGLL